MTPAQPRLVPPATDEPVEYRIGADGKRYPTKRAKRQSPGEPRGEVDKALARLEELVRRHGPDAGAQRWVESLEPDVARAFASVWALVAARRLVERAVSSERPPKAIRCCPSSRESAARGCMRPRPTGASHPSAWAVPTAPSPRRPW